MDLWQLQITQSGVIAHTHVRLLKYHLLADCMFNRHLFFLPSYWQLCFANRKEKVKHFLYINF